MLQVVNINAGTLAYRAARACNVQDIKMLIVTKNDFRPSHESYVDDMSAFFFFKIQQRAEAIMVLSGSSWPCEVSVSVSNKIETCQTGSHSMPNEGDTSNQIGMKTSIERTLSMSRPIYAVSDGKPFQSFVIATDSDWLLFSLATMISDAFWALALSTKVKLAVNLIQTHLIHWTFVLFLVTIRILMSTLRTMTVACPFAAYSGSISPWC